MSAQSEDTVPDDHTAEDATKLVLASADVRRIICVDDSFTASGAVDKAAIIAAVASHQVAADLMRHVAEDLLGDESGTYLAEDEDVEAQAQWLREHQDELSESMWARLGGGAPEGREGATTPQDPETLQLLQQFAATVGIEFFGLNLKGWQSSGEDLVKQDGCSLIFFDRNLSGDGGTEQQGELLLKTAVSEYPVEKLVAVLFTHSVSADDEYVAWQNLAGSDSDHRDRLLVIAKQRLRADRKSFASDLKMAILAPRLRRVAERVRDGFSQQAASAAERLVALSPHVLHTILVSSVAKEGSWGPDGLVGIASAHLRRGVEMYVRADAEVREGASQLREISHRSHLVPLPGGAAEEYSDINRDRLYDDATHVNELRLPIDTGDIFAFFDPLRDPSVQTPRDLWIVVVQRCDLAVRKDGTRNYNPPLMPLARISKVSDSDTARVGAGAIARVEFVASPPPLKSACEVNLMKRSFVPSIALDACALNSDGIARLDANAAVATEGLTSSWAALANHHSEWCSKKLDHYRSLAAGIGNNAAMAKVLMGAIAGASKEINGFGAVVDDDSRSIIFGIRRVARLREPYSQDLMERMGSLASRIPLEAVVRPDE